MAEKGPGDQHRGGATEHEVKWGVSEKGAVTSMPPVSLPSSESSFPAEGVRKQNWNALHLCLSAWVCPQMTSFLSTQIHEKRQIKNFDYKIKPFLC